MWARNNHPSAAYRAGRCLASGLCQRAGTDNSFGLAIVQAGTSGERAEPAHVFSLDYWASAVPCPTLRLLDLTKLSMPRTVFEVDEYFQSLVAIFRIFNFRSFFVEETCVTGES